MGRNTDGFVIIKAGGDRDFRNHFENKSAYGWRNDSKHPLNGESERFDEFLARGEPIMVLRVNDSLSVPIYKSAFNPKPYVSSKAGDEGIIRTYEIVESICNFFETKPVEAARESVPRR